MKFQSNYCKSMRIFETQFIFFHKASFISNLIVRQIWQCRKEVYDRLGLILIDHKILIPKVGPCIFAVHAILRKIYEMPQKKEKTLTLCKMMSASRLFLSSFHRGLRLLVKWSSPDVTGVAGNIYRRTKFEFFSFHDFNTVDEP